MVEPKTGRFDGVPGRAGNAADDRAVQTPVQTSRIRPADYDPPVVPELLPRCRRAMQAIEDERWLAKLRLEPGEPDPKLVNGAAGGDPARMRGLPMIARGVKGAAPGTDPVGELLGKEERASRARRRRP
jgi:hypothetical protein